MAAISSLLLLMIIAAPAISQETKKVPARKDIAQKYLWATEAIVPDKADPKQLAALRNEMLSYYVTARHLYVTQSYRRNTRAQRAKAAAE